MLEFPAKFSGAPNDSRLAFGVELNQVVQRDFDQLFGLRDYEVTTGHASAYWDVASGYGFQVDAGVIWPATGEQRSLSTGPSTMAGRVAALRH